jgi:cytidylate kinase
MRAKDKKLTIAIDGFSSCGKSTVAKDLARRLNYIYIDTGAMYRAVTFYAMTEGLIDGQKVDLATLENQLQHIRISFKYDPLTASNETYLNGKSVETAIRGLEVSNNVSTIATLAFVRKRLVELQQEMGKQGGIVMDGRDIGTVVFPQADLKVFMTASPEIRAKRRHDELQAKGESVSLEAIVENVKNRDHIDSTRTESPLQQADDALVLDNSFLSKEEQLDWIIDKLNSL